ncbi:MAG: response regulator transcription factor [Mediterraneibacter gnavus]|jgi:two-component system OmpR family response regulator|uniref:Stage 0 sporulation protein A homolog n=1 Tax=Mediterraneibacter gnavus TaxID=33038 RepID=A0A6N3F3V8_MEDGN
MSHILIIDDDIHINEMLEEVLIQEGYQVSHAYSGTEALLFLANEKPDLILLDLMLPGLTGEEVLPQIEKIPVIVMSAKVEVKDKVALLLNGAEDYITKPFEIEELLARIVVQLRKSTRLDSSEKLMYREITVNMVTHEAWVGEYEVKLTKTEFAILKILLEHPKQVITKTVLLDRVSEETPDCMESSLRVHISNLRKKLREISGKDYIEAVWGIGFKMAE